MPLPIRRPAEARVALEAFGPSMLRVRLWEMWDAALREGRFRCVVRLGHIDDNLVGDVLLIWGARLESEGKLHVECRGAG